MRKQFPRHRRLKTKKKMVYVLIYINRDIRHTPQCR